MGLSGKILKATRKVGVPQGGVISPLFSNKYLTCIDRMFERAISETQHNGYQQKYYCRFGDDMVILVNGHPSLEWLVKKAMKRLTEALAPLRNLYQQDNFT